MLDGLKPYPNHKPSPVLGLPSIPAHWSAPRLKTVFREVDRRSGTGREPLLSLRMQQGLIDHHEAGGKLIPPASLAHYKLAAPGELVMNRMRAAAGLFGVPPKLGLVSPDYAVLRPRSQVQLEYFLNLFKTPVMMSAFRLESRGLGTGESGFLRLYTERFGMLAAPVPPPDEQAAIVRFLDHADRRIRRYIRAKQKLIKLLEEQKQAIIHQAVTRGLDPSVPVKDSGVEWLGRIPEHWDVALNQRLFRETTRPYRGSDETQLSLSQRDGLIPTSAMKERSLQTASFDKWKIVEPGDLVLNRFKAHLGVFFAASLRGIVTFHYGVFRARRPIIAKYYELLYHTPEFRCIYAGRSNGMTVGLQNLSNQNFYNVRSPVPPVDEQARIVSWCGERTRTVDQALGAARTEIDLLRELRTRLIADVVTGQLDVRSAAAALPDEPTDDEPLDDADDSGDSCDDDLDADAAPEDDDA